MIESLDTSFASQMGAGPIMDRETFGAAVVGKTLDYMNNQGPSMAPVDGETFGAAVVNKTLDYMNAPMAGASMGNTMGGMEQSYDFQTSVLGAAYSGSGTILDFTI